MSIEYRPIADSEIPDFVRVVNTAMGNAYSPERLPRSMVPELDYRVGAFDGGALAGSAGSFTFDMTVPGGIALETSGLTHVGVYPTHRRRGILSGMIRRCFDEAHRRGQVLSALFASEGSIYKRFGYGMASLQGDMELPRTNTAFAPAFAAPASPATASPATASLATTGEARVRYVTEEECVALYPPIWDRVRLTTPGMCTRSEAWWRDRRASDPEILRGGRPALQRIVLELEGRPAGYALYRMGLGAERYILRGALEVVEAVADSPAATRALWRWLFDLDLVGSIKASLLPVDHPLFFLLTDARMMRASWADGLWVRLIDVAGALSRRTYEAGAPLVFDVSDTWCPWNAGRYLLADGVAQRTDRAPDISLDVSALGSAYLGAFGFVQMALAGQVHEHTEGALARADILFHSSRAPWCPEIF